MKATEKTMREYFLNFLRGMETFLSVYGGRSLFGFLNFLRGMETIVGL